MAENEFKKGDKVRLKKLGQMGIILEKTPKGLYRVGIGSMNVDVKARDLEPAPADKWKRYSDSLQPKKFAVQGKIAEEKMPDVLDLHGMRVAEALPRVAHFIDQAILADADSAQILHGLGTGKLLGAVHAYLKKTSVVKSFQLDSNNAGVTIVYF